MATERKTMIKLKESAKELSNALDGHLKGTGNIAEVAEGFFELVSTAEKFAMSPEGRLFNEAVQKCATRGHDG